MNAVVASLAGAGAAGFLQILLVQMLEPAPLLRERIFLVLAGNLGVALLAGLIAAWRRLGTGRSFLAGLALGLGPLAGGLTGASWWAGVPVAVAGILLALRLGPRPGRTSLPGGLALLALASLYVPVHAAWVLPWPLTPFPVGPAPALAPPPGNQTAPGAPDVLLIVADTLRADAILDPGLDTPNLDALRRSGTWAEKARAPCNQTLPSHLSLLCCLGPQKTGMRSNPSAWPLAAQLRRRWECRTLAARFGDAGYRTAAVVSNALLSHVERESGRQTFADGFQSWNGLLREEGWNGLWGWKRRDTWLGWITALTGLQVAINRPLHKLFRSNAVRPVRQHLGEGEVTAANALRWLDDLLAAPRPYFFLVHFMDPHSPYIPPPPYRGTVSDPSILPPGTDVSNRGEFELREIPGKILSGAWRGSRDEARAFARFDHDRYREEVLYLDAMVGRILERVRRSGRPTYILFTADHGEAFGEHDFMEHGTSVYEEEIAVPFVLNGPKVPAGHKLEQAPDLVDAGFTLLSLAGADTAHADGRNVLEGKTRPPTLVLINENRARNAALIDEPWKLVCGLDYGPDPRPGRFELTPRALFNLAEDPGETKDLLPSREDVAQTMLAVLRARLDKDLFPFLEKRHLSPEERADLSQLGYLSFGIPEDESDDPHEERK